MAKEKGMSIATATRDGLMLNLARAIGVKLRMSTLSRVDTLDSDGDPLNVGGGAGVLVRGGWNRRDASDGVGASLKGVPLELLRSAT